MTEPAQEKKKIWRFIENIESDALEAKLNELADAGYHIFRVERVEREYPPNSISDPYAQELPRFVYTIVAFDAAELGARSAATMTAALQKVAGLPTG